MPVLVRLTEFFEKTSVVHPATKAARQQVLARSGRAMPTAHDPLGGRLPGDVLEEMEGRMRTQASRHFQTPWGRQARQNRVAELAGQTQSLRSSTLAKQPLSRTQPVTHRSARIQLPGAPQDSRFLPRGFR